MELLTYTLSPLVLAFSTRRGGGVSQGNYASFNANAYCGDNPEAVRANRELLARELSLPTDRFIIPRQTHGARVGNIDTAFLRLDETARSAQLEGIDALITSQPDICLCVSTADCVPIVVFDRTHRAAACIHAGWRGTLHRIARKTLDEMAENYGTQGADCRAAIGPAISMENFEVGDEVYEAFVEQGFCMNPISKRLYKWHIDLAECNRRQLMDFGIAATDIHTANICTYQHSSTYFSARKLGTNSGRILTGITIKSD